MRAHSTQKNISNSYHLILALRGTLKGSISAHFQMRKQTPVGAMEVACGQTTMCGKPSGGIEA